jgi:hypothetical protein
MSNNPSRKITVTFPSNEGEEIEQAALLKGVPAPQIIRERLAEWQQQAPIFQQQPSAQFVQLESGILFFKEFMERLNHLEQQASTVQRMVQQILNEDIPGATGIELPRFLTRMERLEAILEGIHVLVERVAREVTSNPEEEEAVIQEIQTTLERFLEEHQ